MKWIKTFLICAMLGTLAPQVALALPKEIQADRYLLLAKEAIDKGDFASAVGHFESIKVLGTAVPDVYWFHYGKALTNTFQSEKAIAALTTYLEKTGQGGKFYVESLELYSKAEADIKNRPKRMAEDLVKVLSAMGGKYYKDGRYNNTLEYRASLPDANNACNIQFNAANYMPSGEKNREWKMQLNFNLGVADFERDKTGEIAIYEAQASKGVPVNYLFMKGAKGFATNAPGWTRKNHDPMTLNIFGSPSQVQEVIKLFEELKLICG